jgi:hypothetical protein
MDHENVLNIIGYEKDVDRLRYNFFSFKLKPVISNTDCFYSGIRDRGKRVDSVWVFGGVEGESRKFCLVLIENRSAITLLKVIQGWIVSGTTIISDCWKAYDHIE